MKYFAEVVNNKVINIVQTEEDSLDFMPTDGKFIETSPEGLFRFNAASIGGDYNLEKDGFVQIKPYDSWTFNEDTLRYDPPVVKPEGPAAWDEINQRWNTPE